MDVFACWIISRAFYGVIVVVKDSAWFMDKGGKEETAVVVVEGGVLRQLLEWLETLPLTEDEKYHLLIAVLQGLQSA